MLMIGFCATARCSTRAWLRYASISPAIVSVPDLTGPKTWVTKKTCWQHLQQLFMASRFKLSSRSPQNCVRYCRESLSILDEACNDEVVYWARPLVHYLDQKKVAQLWCTSILVADDYQFLKPIRLAHIYTFAVPVENLTEVDHRVGVIVGQFQWVRGIVGCLTFLELLSSAQSKCKLR